LEVHFGTIMNPGPGQKRMKKLAVAVAATALLGAGAAAQQAAQTAGPRALVPAPKMATSHPSTQPGTGSPTKRATGPSTKGGASTALSVDSQNELVKQYCAGCHSERGKAGGLSLASFDAATIEEHADVAEKMIRKLRTGMMPPPNARRPEAAVVTSLVETLEHKIDAAAALNPNPGWRPFQRLNRAEYQRAVRDLVGVDIDVTAFLPPDTISRGFDNVADVQNFSPTLMESYLRAASQISRLAVGDRTASPTSVTYKIGRTASQMRQVEGAPMGTRGGISVVHTFPADGEYVDAQRAARRDLRPHHDGDAGHQGAGRGFHQRRARGAGRPQRADERDRSEEQP
jgi:mono/diheme cytochrome c family protein